MVWQSSIQIKIANREKLTFLKFTTFSSVDVTRATIARPKVRNRRFQEVVGGRRRCRWREGGGLGAACGLMELDCFSPPLLLLLLLLLPVQRLGRRRRSALVQQRPFMPAPDRGRQLDPRPTDDRPTTFNVNGENHPDRMPFTLSEREIVKLALYTWAFFSIILHHLCIEIGYQTISGH